MTPRDEESKTASSQPDPGAGSSAVDASRDCRLPRSAGCHVAEVAVLAGGSRVVQGGRAWGIRPGGRAPLARRALPISAERLMASVEPHRWKLCRRCEQAGRPKPADAARCRGKITAWRDP